MVCTTESTQAGDPDVKANDPGQGDKEETEPETLTKSGLT